MFKNMLTNEYVSKMVLHGKFPHNWWWLGVFFFFAVHIGNSWVCFAVEICWVCDVDCGVTHTGDGSQVVLQWWW